MIFPQLVTIGVLNWRKTVMRHRKIEVVASHLPPDIHITSLSIKQQIEHEVSAHTNSLVSSLSALQLLLVN